MEISAVSVATYDYVFLPCAWLFIARLQHLYPALQFSQALLVIGLCLYQIPQHVAIDGGTVVSMQCFLTLALTLLVL